MMVLWMKMNRCCDDGLSFDHKESTAEGDKKRKEKESRDDKKHCGGDGGGHIIS
jgi:hypothetical protein